ncbi:MAG: hypothetical protein HQL16_06820 [Candidatus Omnitrophica bacterium]|nr:hypothetical protein [Candidatus Omnitrophota bacterium]
MPATRKYCAKYADQVGNNMWDQDVYTESYTNECVQGYCKQVKHVSVQKCKKVTCQKVSASCRYVRPADGSPGYYEATQQLIGPCNGEYCKDAQCVATDLNSQTLKPFRCAYGCARNGLCDCPYGQECVRDILGAQKIPCGQCGKCITSVATDSGVCDIAGGACFLNTSSSCLAIKRGTCVNGTCTDTRGPCKATECEKCDAQNNIIPNPDMNGRYCPFSRTKPGVCLWTVDSTTGKKKLACFEETCGNLGMSVPCGPKGLFWGMLNCCAKGQFCYPTKDAGGKPVNVNGVCCNKGQTPVAVQKAGKIYYYCRDNNDSCAGKKGADGKALVACPPSIAGVSTSGVVGFVSCCPQGTKCAIHTEVIPLSDVVLPEGIPPGLIDLWKIMYGNGVPVVFGYCGKDKCASDEVKCGTTDGASLCCKNGVTKCSPNGVEGKFPMCQQVCGKANGTYACGDDAMLQPICCKIGLEACVNQPESPFPSYLNQCVPVAVPQGALSYQTSSNAVFLVRDTTVDLALDGTVYVTTGFDAATPSGSTAAAAITFNSPVSITMQPYDQNQFETYKFTDSQAVLDACTATLLDSVSKDVSAFNGGVVSLGNNEIIMSIPSKALPQDSTIKIDKYNLTDCYQFNTQNTSYNLKYLFSDDAVGCSGSENCALGQVCVDGQCSGNVVVTLGTGTTLITSGTTSSTGFVLTSPATVTTNATPNPTSRLTVQTTSSLTGK